MKIQDIFKKLPYFYIFEENGKSGRGGGGGCGIFGCHVISQQGKPVDLAVSMSAAMKR
jgi:hypothetical protein